MRVPLNTEIVKSILLLNKKHHFIHQKAREEEVLGKGEITGEDKVILHHTVAQATAISKRAMTKGKMFSAYQPKLAIRL